MVATVAMAMEAMVATGVDTARGLLRLRLSLDTAMAATGVAAMDTTARGRLRLSPVTAMAATVMAVDTVAMVATGATAMVATARGLLSLATATGATAMVAMATATAGAMATGVSYHRIIRSELS